MNELPLSGIRVIELGQYVAGPAAAMILGQLGADIIKVEPPVGEPLRKYPRRTLFATLNRNKASFAIDLKQSEGRELYLKLVDTADVVLDNLLPETLERLGIGYSTLVARKPDLIYCGIRGFLPGARGDRPLFDGSAQMMAGLAYMTGPPGRPLPAGVPIVDLTAGVWSALGILAGLLSRAATGNGQHLNVGLFETAAFWVGSEVAQASVTHTAPRPTPKREEGGRPEVGVYRLFTTLDERSMLIQVVSDSQWERLCSALGFDDLWADLTLRTPPGRAIHYLALEARVSDAAALLTAAELTERLETWQVPHAAVNTPLDLLSDTHLKETGGLVEVPLADADNATCLVPGLPVRTDAYPALVPAAAPRVGDASRALLETLGIGPEEVRRLQAADVVRLDP